MEAIRAAAFLNARTGSAAAARGSKLRLGDIYRARSLKTVQNLIIRNFSKFFDAFSIRNDGNIMYDTIIELETH